MSKFKIQPRQPEKQQNSGLTFEQKITLVSLALVACMVLAVFVGLFSLYRPQQTQVIVVTATAVPTEFALPTAADMAQNQVNNGGSADEATSTPTVTSVPLITVDTTAFYATVDAVGGLPAYSATDWANRQSTSEAVISTNEALGTPRPTPTPTSTVLKFEDMPECIKPYLTPESDGTFSFDYNDITDLLRYDASLPGHYTKVPFSWKTFTCP